MKKIKYSLLSGVLALSAASGVISVASSKKDMTAVSATSLSTLVTRQLVWSTATSDTNFEWSAPLRTVNDFNIGWVGLSTQYYISNFTWTYKNNEQNIVDSMTFTKMYFDTNNSSASLSVTVKTIVDGVVKKTQSIPATHISSPNTHWVSDNIVTVTGLSSLVGNKQVSFKFEATGSTTRFGFVKDEYFSVIGYASTKVTLDNQGGSTNSSVYLIEGYPMPSVSVPTKEDYEFDGYYSEVEGGGTKYYNANGTPALESAGNASTLYAKWNRVGTNITLDKDGGTGGDDSTLGVLDQTLADVIVPTRPGYTFNGYYSESNGQGTQYYNENGQSSFVWNSEAASATFYASWTIKPEAQNAITKINEIGTVTYSEDSLTKLNAAQSAYDAVDAADKAGVSNYSTLEAGWDTYNAQKQAGADAVKDLITAIGTVALEKENDIVSAREAYDALTNEQKDLVTNHSTLVAAEERLAELKENKAAADVVVNKINAIGGVKYPDSYNSIKEARDAYNALTNDEQRGFVSNYATLTAAEIEYENQKASGVNNAKNLIDAIGEVSYSDESKAKIDAARSAYDALTAEQKTLVGEEYLAKLVDAEAAYKSLDDNYKADQVDSLIALIGTVEDTKACKDKIDAARNAYDALTDEQKALVENYSTLVAAEERLAELKENKAAADVVVDKINAIGEVSYSDESKAKIDAARNAYNALTNDEQRGFVSNYATLTAAEIEYENQKVSGVNNAKNLIDAIGEVTYPDSGAAIAEARSAYDALTAEQKTLVGEEYLAKLVDAEAAYKSLDDNYKADQVDSLIALIGTVEDTKACKAKIDAARNAYDALTDEQKDLVTNYSTLVAAEKAYSDLHSVNAVQALINAIGEVSYSDESKAKIDAARNAYDALTDEQKALVNNYSTLTHDEEVYKHVDDVVKAIDNIGDVSLDSGSKIKTATEAYDSLTEEERALIPNYHDKLGVKTQTYQNVVSQHKTSVTLAIVFGILGGLILLVLGAWALMLFVFNKWIKDGDKVIRAFKLFGLKKKDGKFLVLAYPVKFVGKEDAELFNSKEEALK